VEKEARKPVGRANKGHPENTSVSFQQMQELLLMIKPIIPFASQVSANF
jgi:hypothetical protein